MSEGSKEVYLVTQESMVVLESVSVVVKVVTVVTVVVLSQGWLSVAMLVVLGLEEELVEVGLQWS
jgi:hypothetical protein